MSFMSSFFRSQKGKQGDLEKLAVQFDQAQRGGSGWLDSLFQFISGAWRLKPTQQQAVQADSPSTRDRACGRQARDAA